MKTPKLHHEGEEPEEDPKKQEELSPGKEEEPESKFKKVEMPIFFGDDPDSWLFRVEWYFEIHRLSDEEKMTVTVISFDGATLKWYRWVESRRSFTDWIDLKTRMFERFSESKDKNLLSTFFPFCKKERLQSTTRLSKHGQLRYPI